MRGFLAAFASVVGLAACASPDPPLLALGGRTCDAQPRMDGAVPVPFDTSGGASVKIGPDSPCMVSGRQVATYAVFNLPETASPYMATVSSEVVGRALIPPRVTVFDAAGAVTRSMGTKDFRSDLSGYRTGLRLGPHDRLMLVAADPAHLGEGLTLRLSARQVGFQVAAAAAVPIILLVPAATPAQMTEQPATLSLNGRFRVVATPIARVP